MKQVESIVQIVEAKVRACFEEIISKQIDEIEAQAIQKIESCITKQRQEAKLAAARMTLDLLHRAEIHGISVELKI